MTVWLCIGGFSYREQGKYLPKCKNTVIVLPNRSWHRRLFRSQAAFLEWFHDLKKICEEVSLESVLKWSIYKKILYFFLNENTAKHMKSTYLICWFSKFSSREKKLKQQKNLVLLHNGGLCNGYITKQSLSEYYCFYYEGTACISKIHLMIQLLQNPPLCSSAKIPSLRLL